MPWGPVNQAQSIEDPTGVYPQAQLDTVDLQILVAGVGGANGVSGAIATSCLVTAQGSPNNTVAVASGTVVVNFVEVAVSSGNVTMTAAHATLARFDLITVTNAGVKTYTAGTAAATPVFPAIPANSVVLASIYVDSNDNVINANQISDRRVPVPSPAATGGWTTVEKSVSTLRNNTSTLAADPELFFVMVANGEYRLRGRVLISTNPNYPTLQPNFKYRFVGPASPSIVNIHHLHLIPTTGALAGEGLLTAYSASDHNISYASIFITQFEFDGFIHNGANAGNFELHWAQQTAAAIDTYTLAGSYIDWARAD